MRVLLLLICVALSACASRWVNPRNPTADLQADTAFCDKDAERVMRLELLITQPLANCPDSRGCAAVADQRAMQLTMRTDLARKQCMQARGWRQQ